MSVRDCGPGISKKSVRGFSNGFIAGATGDPRARPGREWGSRSFKAPRGPRRHSQRVERPDGGAEFVIRIRRIAAGPKEEPIARRANGTGSARILIVDDEPSILKAMAPLLRSRGYDVETAARLRGARGVRPRPAGSRI